MRRVFAVILVMLGLFSQLGLDALSICGTSAQVEVADECCEKENVIAVPQWADESCRQECAGCVCVKRVEHPAINARVDRQAEPSDAFVFSIAIFVPPTIVPSREVIAFCRVNESPPHIRALRTIHLSI